MRAKPLNQVQFLQFGYCTSETEVVAMVHSHNCILTEIVNVNADKLVLNESVLRMITCGSNVAKRRKI